MRRFLLPVLVLSLALLLPACGRQQSSKWGNLQVTLENVQQADRQWTARLVVKNPTDKVQVLQFQSAPRYTMVVTQGKEEILRQAFDVRATDQPEILNLSKGVAKEYVVAWTYLDKDGNRVKPGTYEISVQLEAITVAQEPGKSEPTAFDPKVVGPVRVTVK